MKRENLGDAHFFMTSVFVTSIIKLKSVVVNQDVKFFPSNQTRQTSVTLDFISNSF